MNICDFTVKAMDGSEVALSQFAGKVVKEGNIAARFEPTAKLEKVKAKIKELL